MSSRWYPIYQRGNPQLRIFLPNFWLKLIRPEINQPSNVVQFACSMQMTKYDIKNYLEKIYKIPVCDVATRIAPGKTKKDPGQGYIVKEDDVKLAYVKLPKDQSFVFPDIFPKIKEEEDNLKNLDDAKKEFRKYLTQSKNRPGIPAWYSI